ncbi:hypothetical protein LTR97_001512 [Elasticomyces elasticus]|uniref:Uncharacterized protein n=1 Tax=Elasticomyces elasticus TaxID=574655 RepID=A0AAN7ZQH5_9PEZI|nr:hypothetical protein LTR97_001512 [Elasticomyces elasticus]
MTIRRSMPPDGEDREVTCLDEMDGSSYTSKVDPKLRTENSKMRDILPELSLQHTLSRRSYQTVEDRRDEAVLKGEDTVKFCSKIVYHVDFVTWLLKEARGNLPNGWSVVVGQQSPDQPSAASDSDGDTQNDSENMGGAHETAHSFDMNAMARPAEDYEMVKGAKRKFSRSGNALDGDSSARAGKRQKSAIDGCEVPSMEENKRKDSSAEAVTTPVVTQSANETARALIASQVNAQSVSQDEQMLTAVQHTEVTVHRIYTNKAAFEADRALLGHKHGLAKAREGTEDQHAGDSLREVQTGSALDPVLPTLDTLGADAGTGSDVEYDDEVGDASGTQAGLDVSTWHTSTTYRDHRDDRLTLEQITKADALAKSCPLELWRVSAATGSNHTQGWTSQQHIKPPAAVEGLKSGAPIYKELSDFPSLSALSRNLAGRLLCTQSNVDQREALGQGGILITRVVTRKINILNGKQAKFHFVPELLDILGVAEWEGLSGRARHMLTGVRFHHEYVALGELDLTRNPYRPVQFDELKANGLYNFRPGIHVEGNEVEEKKLYYRKLQLSHQWYGPETTAHSDTLNLTNQFLSHAARLARLFDHAAQASGDNAYLDVDISLPKASLSIFIDLLSLFRRQRGDQLFMRHIRDNYSTQEVQGILYQGIERIPNNSPDRLQVLDRIREACIAVRIPEPPATEVMLVDALFDFDGVWHGDPKKTTGVIAPWHEPETTSTAGPGATVGRVTIGKPILTIKAVSSVAKPVTKDASKSQQGNRNGLGRLKPSLMVKVDHGDLNQEKAGSIVVTTTSPVPVNQHPQVDETQSPEIREALFTRFSLWWSQAVLDLQDKQYDRHTSASHFDQDIKEVLDECRKQSAEGIRYTCWISGVPFDWNNAWLTKAAKLAEAHSQAIVRDPARIATIRKEYADLIAGSLTAPSRVDIFSDEHGFGCSWEGCGSMSCSTCDMRPKNKLARRKLEIKQGFSWEFGPERPSPPLRVNEPVRYKQG